MMSVAALIVAAGRGTRAATGKTPKQFVQIAGQALLAHTLKPFFAHPSITHILVVRHADNTALYQAAISSLGPQSKLLPCAIGGETRQQSVLAGLQQLARIAPGLVLIHDAARPFVTRTMLDDLLSKLEVHAGVLLASEVTDTIKRVGDFGLIEETVARETLWRAETPQAFRFADILAAHTRAVESGLANLSDDTSVAEWAGIPVAVVNSGGGNTKITFPVDIEVASYRLTQKAPMVPIPDIRVGQGFDVHRFKDGDHVWLCGVRIPHTHGVDAHSDGDVGLHALTDALLGAIADGDIGLHFKNTDPRWKGASSDQFLADAKRRVIAAGGTISNVDLTLLCEAPKITPHRDAMRVRIASILEIEVDRVGVKATTTELMGFTGRREGLAAMASATVLMQANS